MDPLLGMGPHLKGFDPKTGKELWRCDGLTSYVYTSPLYGNGIAVAMSGFSRNPLTRRAAVPSTASESSR